MNDEKRQVLFTPFECDRCGRNNAVTIKIATKKISNNLIHEDVDLCEKCIIGMIAILIKKVPWDEREAWVKSFKDGIIN